MKRSIDSLPNWCFDIDEVSVGVYRIVGTHTLGCSIERTGTDYDKLMERAEKDVRQMQAALERKGRRL